jgi:hypothetical protein
MGVKTQGEESSTPQKQPHNPQQPVPPAIQAARVDMQTQLTGLITWIETTTENINFNYYRFFSQLILFFMFLPLLIAIFTISFVLWISLAILGFSALSRDVSPFNIANTINSIGVLIAIAFPRVHQRHQVPAVRLTVQGPEGERPALIKGELTSGTYRRGDEIELEGCWKNGTLIVQRGFNRTLNTSIAIRGDYWRYVLIGLLGLITAALIIVIMRLG